MNDFFKMIGGIILLIIVLGLFFRFIGFLASGGWIGAVILIIIVIVLINKTQ